MESTQNKTRCPHSKKCGGCQLQNLDYKEQLAHKERTCIRLLGKFCRVEPIIGMENPYHYRNKVQAAFGTTRAGRIISGIYQSSTHNIVAVDSCMNYLDLSECMPREFEMLLLASARVICEVPTSILSVQMPIKASDLVNTVNMILTQQERRRRKEKQKPKARSWKEQNYISNAKMMLMQRNHLSEDEAYRYIQKSSMDSGTNMVETAQMLLMLLYDG